VKGARVEKVTASNFQKKNIGRLGKPTEPGPNLALTTDHYRGTNAETVGGTSDVSGRMRYAVWECSSLAKFSEESFAPGRECQGR
jgi:hypothetical protein